jgi:hypothetical protein
MMNRATRWTWSVLALTAFFPAISVAVEACGSDSFTSAPSTDGGGEGSAETGTPDNEAGGADSGCLAVPAGLQPGDVAFCDAFAEVYDRCGSCESCRQTDVSNCAEFSAALSDSYKAAIVACKDTLSCDNLQSQNLSSDCITKQFSSAAPTAEQTTVKNAYCAKCTDIDAGDLPCDDFFFQADGGASAGAAVLLVSDPIAADIKTACVDLGICGAAGFYVCAGNQLCNGKDKGPTTACSSGFCKP